MPHPRWLPTPPGAGHLRDVLERRLQAWCVTAILPLKPADVHSANLMLRCDFWRGDLGRVGGGEEGVSPRQALWFIACSGNSQAGAVPFRLNLNRLELGDDTAEGSEFLKQVVSMLS